MVLVLDIHLGPASGFDLYERLRSLGLGVPTIFMTGRDDARTRERASRAGATAYLVKPIEETVLQRDRESAAVERALTTRRSCDTTKVRFSTTFRSG